MSEHTKETLEYSGNTEIIGLQIRETGERIGFIKPANYVRAEHLVKCWNEHDELRAKAECCEELVAACEEMLGRLRRYYEVHKAVCKLPDCPDKRAIELAKAALEQVKEIVK